ncbi:MAG: site-2 protease family protein, partial [Clostridia bacterium]|nr:site-2 protease family protein [Clostridia bacterium]
FNQIAPPIEGDWFYQLYFEMMGDGITPLTVVAYALELFAYLNVGLALFNLIPIPPLDGSNVLVAFLSNNAAAKYLQIRYYTRYIFLGLMLLSVASRYSAMAGMLYSLIWLPFDLLREGLFFLFTSLGELIFSFI